MEACGSTPYGSLKMNKELHFPWTFDQYHRYRVLNAALKFFFKEKSPVVLDVGGVSPRRGGGTFWLPIREIVPDKSYVLDTDYVRLHEFIQGDAAHLPFEDNSVDVVSALDVLEHIAPQKREGILEEFGRVSQDLILLSVPEATKEVRAAEDMLYDQVKKLYGINHAQLEEHRRFGLPEIETLSEILRSLGFSEIHFSYGSLTNWIFFQSLKHGFFFRPESDSILEGIDWFEAQYLKGTEFQPPFIRHFWAASKKREESELKDGVKWIQNQLKEKSDKSEKSPKQVSGELDRLKSFNRALIRSLSREKTTVMILAESGGQKLRECLKHILSQKVYFDLEVSVLNITENPDIKYMIKAFYPAVKYLSWKTPHPAAFREKMLELFCELQGDYILILDEARLLPQDSVTQIFEKMRENPKILIINSDSQWVFMRRKIFSSQNWDKSQMKRTIEKMNKEEIFMTLRQGYRENHKE